MPLVIGIGLGIFLFFALVLIHEFGHFLAAKKSGVKVLEFGIGIPPKLKTFYTDKSGTEYTINALPLGGFVRLKWEDPENSEEFNARDSLISAKIHKKIIIILGWVMMNFLTAWLIFTTVFTIWTQPVSVVANENIVASNAHSYLMPSLDFLKEQWLINQELKDIPVTILNTTDDSILKNIWLSSWDMILSIDNNDINPRNLIYILKNLKWESHIITYQRWSEITSLDFECIEENCVLGIDYSKIWVLEISDIKFPLWKAMIASLQEINAEMKITFNALWKLWWDLFSFNSKRIKSSMNGLTWPVWAVKFWQIILEYDGWIVFLAFAGMISLALAIFNILPIPALDGGRLLGMLIQRWLSIYFSLYYYWFSEFILWWKTLSLLGGGIFRLLEDKEKLIENTLWHIDLFTTQT